MTEYPGNTNRVKYSKPEAKPKLQPVAKGSQRKTPLGKKLREAFTGDDAHTVGNYVLMDVVLPAVKNMLSDAISQGAERMLFGESRPRGSSVRHPGQISYNRVSTPPRQAAPQAPGPARRARGNMDFGEIVLPTRYDAEMVLDRLSDVIENYDVATVADLYELVEITGSFTDVKWGWTSLRDARVRQVREGFILELPQPVAID